MSGSGKMKLRYIPSFITLLAGAITCLICIIKGYDVLYSLEVLLITLIIFAVIGFIAQAIVRAQMEENARQEEERLLEEKRKALEEEYAKQETEGEEAEEENTETEEEDKEQEE